MNTLCTCDQKIGDWFQSSLAIIITASFISHDVAQPRAEVKRHNFKMASSRAAKAITLQQFDDHAQLLMAW